MRLRVINETRDSLPSPSPSPSLSSSSSCSFSLSSLCVRDKIDFMAVVLALANISDAIMQRHRARARAEAVARTAARLLACRARVTRSRANPGLRCRGGPGRKSLRYFRGIRQRYPVEPRPELRRYRKHGIITRTNPLDESA